MSARHLIDLFAHLGMLGALFLTSRQMFRRITRERRLASLPPRRRKRPPDSQAILDYALARSAFFPMLLGAVLFGIFAGDGDSLPMTAALFLLNGVILFVPQFLPAGNKDSRSMTPADGLLMGIFGALGILPGLSRIGGVLSMAAARGADKQKALNWALLCLYPMLIVLLALDIFGLVRSGAGAFGIITVLQCILAAAASCGGGYIAVHLMRFLAVKQGFSSFAYYSWGAALFTFILYMTT